MRKYRPKLDRIKWCIYVTPEVVEMVEKYKKHGIYKSDLIENAIRYYLAEKEARHAKQIID